jgi:hypothetical protein
MRRVEAFFTGPRPRHKAHTISHYRRSTECKGVFELERPEGQSSTWIVQTAWIYRGRGDRTRIDVNMLKLSTFRLAQVAIGILILVVIRTLAELIAITSDHPSSDNLYTVYLVGALMAAAAALACQQNLMVTAKMIDGQPLAAPLPLRFCPPFAPRPHRYAKRCRRVFA